MPKYIAVTGCAGFIGRVLTSKLLAAGHMVYGIDALTYAADPEAIREFQRSPNFCFVNRDIRDPQLDYLPDVDHVIHLAAESHVDRSIDGPSRFTSVNVVGTHHLLELARKVTSLKRFIYISTDEVYGSIEAPWKADASWPLKPSSPYAASKAAADLMVQAYGTTYGLPYLIIRPTNAYGPHGQYPEKLIPKAVRSLTLGRPIPIHGDGSQTRCWLHVEDCADAVIVAMEQAHKLPPIVNVGGNAEVAVRDVAAEIAGCFDMEWGYWEDNALIALGGFRPGQDTRYAVADEELRAVGWQPKGHFLSDLPGIVAKERESFRF